MPEYIDRDDAHDGIDRRGFLKCMAWAGAGVVWAMKGGILQSRAFGADMAGMAGADFTFVQVSDSHIGFNKGVYTDVVGTFQHGRGSDQRPARKRRRWCCIRGI